jgi:hypothetical protein
MLDKLTKSAVEGLVAAVERRLLAELRASVDRLEQRIARLERMSGIVHTSPHEANLIELEEPGGR